MKLFCLTYDHTEEWRVPGTDSAPDTVRKEVRERKARIIAPGYALAAAWLSTQNGHMKDPAFIIKNTEELDVHAVIGVNTGLAFRLAGIGE